MPWRALAAGWAFGLMASVFAASPGLAQADGSSPDESGAPTRLVPESGDGGTRRGAAPSQRGDDASDAAGETDGGPSGIEVDRLAPPGAGTVGTLDSDGEGLGSSLWQGTPRRLIVALLPRIPADLHDSALRDLARRLLLSSTAPPSRKEADTSRVSLLRLRFERLMALGYYADVAALFQVVPRRKQTGPLQRQATVARLLAGKLDPACQTVSARIAESDAIFWQKAMAVCQFARGERRAADLTVSLLRELGGDTAAGFLAAYDVVAGGADAEMRAPLSPLVLALFRRSETAIPAAALRSTSPGVMRVIARHEATPLARRMEAAERASAVGALPPAELRALYKAADFHATRLEAAVQQNVIDAPPAGKQMQPAMRRALRYQAARRAETVSLRAELVNAAIAEAAAARKPAARRAFLSVLLEDAPRPDLIWFAGTAGRTLYAAGRADRAGEWLKLAREEALISPDAAAAMTGLWPYARLAGGTAVPMRGGLAAWRQAETADAAALTLRESLLRASFAGLDLREVRTWTGIAAEASAPRRAVPGAALLEALRLAGTAKRRGEVVLLTVIGLGQTGLDAVHPLTLQTALTALRQVGLDEVARRIAVDAALANGI